MPKDGSTSPRKASRQGAPKGAALRIPSDCQASSPRLTTSPPPQIDKHGLPPGIELVDGDNLREWLLDIRVLDNNPIYQGQTYRLRFQFPQAYPIGN